MNGFNVPFYFGGTGLLILVGVSLDTVGQIQAKLATRHYGTIGAPPEGSGPSSAPERVRNRRKRLGGAGPFV